jgi:hypothetical protein
MKYSEMQDRVRSVVRDTQGSFITDEDVENWLNEGQSELAQRLGILQIEITNTTPGAAQIADGSLTLPSDLIDVISLSLDTTAGEVAITDDRTFASYADSAASFGSTLGRIFGGAIVLYPAPADGSTYRLRYVRDLPSLDTTTEEAEGALPAELHLRMVHYARAQAMWKLKDMERGRVYFELFSEGLPPHPLGRSRNTPTLDVTPDGNYFESSEYLS